MFWLLYIRGVMMNYYIMISKKYHLTVRQLREKVKSKEYERLDAETKLKCKCD